MDPRLALQLRVALGVLASAAFAGVVVQGLQVGLTFRLMLRWAVVFTVVTTLGLVLVAGVHRVRGRPWRR